MSADTSASNPAGFPEVTASGSEGTGKAGRNLGDTFVGVASYVDNLPNGERAELRRLRGRFRELPPEVFWRIVERYDIPRRDEEFWMAVLPLMVEHPHHPGCRTGRVLRNSGVSSARLEKWLRLDREDALNEAGRLLSQVDGPINWRQFGYLLYLWSHAEYGERNRRDLARDFFVGSTTRKGDSDDQGGT